MIAGRQPKWVWSEGRLLLLPDRIERAGAPAPTQPSAFHGRAGDTPVRALGTSGERAKPPPPRYWPSARRAVDPATRCLHPQCRRCANPADGSPDASAPRRDGFSLANGRGRTGATRERPPGLLRAQTTGRDSSRTPLRARPPLRTAAPPGSSIRRGRGAGPHLEWAAATGEGRHRGCTRADTDGTLGARG